MWFKQDNIINLKYQSLMIKKSNNKSNVNKILGCNREYIVIGYN